MDPQTIVIRLHLKFDQINLLLGKLGACPFNEVADLIAVIRQQTAASIEEAQRPQQGMQARSPANGAEFTPPSN